MLVVVAILGVLAALLIPTLKSTIEKTRQAKCMNNLKKIYEGFRLYAIDHNGEIAMGFSPANPSATPPTSATWFPFQIGPYLNNGVWAYNSSYNYPPYFVCPSHDLPKYKYLWGSYMMNARVSFGGPYKFLKFNDVSSRLLFLFDANDAGQAQLPTAIIKRHNNGANLLFLDGHVEWRMQFDPAGTGFWLGK
jgi:prepilin-type processing-associated H-X9-DG protein